MGMTIAEKIIARAAGVDAAKAGEIHVVTLDYMLSNDGTTHLTIDKYKNLKNPHIADPSKLVWVVDHNVPCDSVKTAQSQKRCGISRGNTESISTRARAFATR